jgi:pre-mRNA-splicing factor SYF1
MIDFTFQDIDVEKEINSSDEEEEKDELKDDDIEMKMFRLENLMERRPFLLSNVILRQNPHNVYEWMNQIRLCEVNFINPN